MDAGYELGHSPVTYPEDGCDIRDAKTLLPQIGDDGANLSRSFLLH
jgi:hypothetical protein